MKLGSSYRTSNYDWDILGNGDGEISFLEGKIPTVDGDINGDGKVDLIDLYILKNQWLDFPGTPSADIAPIGGDNVVNLLDFAVVAQYWMHGVIK